MMPMIFCAWLLSDFEYENQTIFMAPASGFYTTPGFGKDEVRIAYVLKKEDLAISLKILEEALKVYPRKQGQAGKRCCRKITKNQSIIGEKASGKYTGRLLFCIITVLFTKNPTIEPTHETIHFFSLLAILFAWSYSLSYGCPGFL